MYRLRHIVLVLVLAALLPLSPAVAASPADVVAPPRQPAADRVYIGETGHVVAHGFWALWRGGGPGVYGYPLTGEFDERCAGAPCVVQYFERARFEYDPASGQVRLGLLGREYLDGWVFAREAPFASTAERWYIPETGQALAHGFLHYWLANDGPRQLGLPISPEIRVDGHTVQYFERGRLVYMPANELASRIVVASLGATIIERRGWRLPPGQGTRHSTIGPGLINLLSSGRGIPSWPGYPIRSQSLSI